MKIRHEINLINGTLVASGNVFRTSADERVYVDFSKYSGTLTTYLEVVYTNTILTGSCSVSLFDHLSSTGHGSLPNLSNNVTSYTLYRNINASATNGETGVREYSLAVGTSGSGAGTVTIKSARLVIIQDVGTDPMIRSETRIEIGNRETGKTNTTTQPLSTPKYFRFNSADWDGDIEIIAEATYAISSDMTTCRVWLQTSNDLTTWSNTALIVNGGTSTTVVRVKSSNLTSLITDGMYVRIATDIASSMYTHSVYNAALIIRQSSYTSALAQTTSTSSSFLGNLRVGFGQSFTTVGALSVVAIGIPVSISSGNPTVPVVVKIYSDSAFTSLVATSYSYIGSQLPSSGVFKFPFASPVSLSAGTVYYLAIIFDGTVDTSNFYVISTANTNPYSGGSMYYTNNGTSWTNETASDMYFVLYEEGAGIEKLEEQFLLGNAPAFSGTAAQKFLTKYDPAEFDGVDVGFIHQVDASNDSTNVLQLETEAGTLLTGSIVKSPDNVDFGRGYYSTGAGGNAIGTDLNNISGKGQAFLATGNKIIGGSFHLQKSGSPTGTIYFRLYAGTGTLGTNANVSGSALAEATVDASTLPTSSEEIKFFFSSAVDVTDGGLYVLTCEFVTSNDSNYIVIAQTSDTTGNAVSQTKTTGVWGASSTIDYAMSVRFGTIMPVSSGNIDVKPTTNSGSIFASRILARIKKQSAATGSMTGSAASSATLTGVLSAIVPIAAALSSGVFVSATPTGLAPIAATINNTATVTATGAASAAAAATLSSTGSVSATLSGAASLASSIPNTASFTGTIKGTGSLASSTSSATSLSGVLSGSVSGAASLSASGSITATAKLFRYGVASITSSAFLSGQLTGAGTLASGLSSTASLSATGKLFRYGSAALSSDATLSGNLSGRAPMASNLSASASLSGLIAGGGLLQSSLLGTASVTGVLSGSGALASTIQATGSLVGSMAAPGALSGTIEASASLSGTLSGTTLAASVLLGDGIVTATLIGYAGGGADVIAVGQVSGLIYGLAPITADTSGSGSVSGSITGTAPVSCDLSAVGDLTGTISGQQGSGASIQVQATVNGNLQGSGVLNSSLNASCDINGLLEGNVAGIASIEATGTLAGTLAGTGVCSATLSSNGLLTGAAHGIAAGQSTISCSAALDGNLTGEAPNGAISGTIQCLSSLSGTLSGQVNGQANISAAATLTGTAKLYRYAQASVSSGATVTGLLTGYAQASVQLSTAASTSGTLTGVGSAACVITTGSECYGILIGSADIAATLQVLASLSGYGVGVLPYDDEVLCLTSANIQTTLALESKIDNLVVANSLVLTTLQLESRIQLTLPLLSTAPDITITGSSAVITEILLSSIYKSDQNECV